MNYCVQDNQLLYVLWSKPNSCYKQSQKSYVLAAEPYMIHSWLCRILLKDVPCSQMKKHDDSMPINIFHPTLASHLSLAPVEYCGISPPSPNEPWRLVNSSLRPPHQSWKSGPRCKIFFVFFKLRNQGFCGANPISGYPVTSFELVGKRGINRIESWLCESVGLVAAGIFSAL